MCAIFGQIPDIPARCIAIVMFCRYHQTDAVGTMPGLPEE
jgi:hypothetical protein